MRSETVYVTHRVRDMATFKVHRRSAVLLLIAAVGAVAAFVPGRTGTGQYLHTYPMSDLMQATIADAHNLIESPASGSGESGGRGGPESREVCAFQLQRLGDAQLVGKITIMMPVRRPRLVPKQAYIFKQLDARFRNAGYTNLQFVVAYNDDSGDCVPDTRGAVPSDEPPPAIEDRYERVESLFNVTVLRQRMPASGLPADQFLQSSAYVFDTCGRFVYIIYYPWSLIQRPYLKAAILSTIYDAPCGSCEHDPSTSADPISDSTTVALGSSTPLMHLNLVTDLYSSTAPSIIDAIDNDLPTNSTDTLAANPKRNVPTPSLPPAPDTTLFPMAVRVVAPIAHAHPDLSPDANTTSNAPQHYLKYNYIIMRSDEPSFHGHLPDDLPERLTLVDAPAPPVDTAELDGSSTSQSDDQLAAETSSPRYDAAAAAAAASTTAAPVELHFVTDYGKRYVSPIGATPPPPEDDAPPDGNDYDGNMIASSAAQEGPQRRNQFDGGYVYLEEVPWPSRQRSNTGRMVSVARPEPVIPTGNGSTEWSIIDHYSRVIQWIEHTL